MTGNEIANRVIDLLGYRDSLGNESIDAATKKNIISYINTVYSELFSIEGGGELTLLKTLNDKVSGLSSRASEALIFGVCMWTAFNTGDGDKHNMFAKIYNDRRAGLSQSAQIVNKIPSPEA